MPKYRLFSTDKVVEVKDSKELDRYLDISPSKILIKQREVREVRVSTD